MADRRRDVVLLLGSRFDGLYLPAGAVRSRAGFVPSSLELCPVCDGARATSDRFGRSRPCARCGGRGRLAFDPMDSLHVPVGSESTSATARPRRTVVCDRCAGEGVWHGERCELCRGEGRRDLHAFELHLDTRDEAERDPLLAAIEARNEAGSYRELERALARVRVHVDKPPRFLHLTLNAAAALRLLDEVYLPPVSRREEHLEPGEAQLVELALGYLDSQLPEPIRVPADVRANARLVAEQRKRVRGRSTDERARERRDLEIRRLLRERKPAQWVAGEYGLSVSQVNRIASGDAG